MKSTDVVIDDKVTSLIVSISYLLLLVSVRGAAGDWIGALVKRLRNVLQLPAIRSGTSAVCELWSFSNFEAHFVLGVLKF